MDVHKCKTAVLTTERLILRAAQADDAEDIVRQANNFEVARRLAQMPYPYGEGEAKHFVEDVLPGEAIWAVVRKEGSAFMGAIGLSGQPGEKNAEIGYWLGRGYWGRGFMTEAARAVVHFAFEDLQLSYLYSGHFTDNVASASILTKLGFVSIGKSRKFCLALNSDIDHVDMRLDAADFFSKQTQDMGE